MIRYARFQLLDEVPCIVAENRLTKYKETEGATRARIEEITEDICRFYGEFDRLCEQHRRERVEENERAPEPRCKEWNLAFFKKVHTRLPRELRDIIYEHLWDEVALKQHRDLMEESLNGMYRAVHIPRMRFKEHPHYIKPAYVGSQAALEVVEAWYKAMGRTSTQPIVLQNLRQIERFVTEDVFFVGANPAKVVRRMDLDLDMKHEIFMTPDNWCDEDRFMARYQLKFLDKIENKRGFQLNIRLEQETVRLDMWPLALELFKPVLSTFKKEGAHVRIFWAYQYTYSPRIEPLEIELNSLVEDRGRDWKRDVIAQLDNSGDIEENHKRYETEDIPYLYLNEQTNDDWAISQGKPVYFQL